MLHTWGGDELKASLGYKRSEKPEWFASEKSSQAGKQELFERSAVLLCLRRLQQASLSCLKGQRAARGVNSGLPSLGEGEGMCLGRNHGLSMWSTVELDPNPKLMACLHSLGGLESWPK